MWRCEGIMALSGLKRQQSASKSSSNFLSLKFAANQRNQYSNRKSVIIEPGGSASRQNCLTGENAASRRAHNIKYGGRSSDEAVAAQYSASNTREALRSISW